MKIAEMIEIFPDYHMSPGQCVAFISKLSNDAIIIDITKEFDDIKKRANDSGGVLSYVDPMLQVITKSMRMIDKLISSRMYDNRINQLGLVPRQSPDINMTYSAPQDVSVGATTVPPGEVAEGVYVPGRGYATKIQESDALGNKLWDAGGKPRLKTV